MGRMLKQGFTWNPMKKYPRNLPCPCKSGKKFKHCCFANLPTTIPVFEQKPLEKMVAEVRDSRAKGNC